MQIAEEMAVAMEVAVFSTHLAIAAAAVLCDLLPVDELVDLVSYQKHLRPRELNIYFTDSKIPAHRL